MNTHFAELLDRTIQFAEGFVGDIVAGSLEKAKLSLKRSLLSVIVGAAGLVIAMVFGAIGFERWLVTIVDANHRWVPPLIVAIVCGVVGIAALHSVRGRRGP